MARTIPNPKPVPICGHSMPSPVLYGVTFTGQGEFFPDVED
jgi:hypothetical protein